MKPRTRNASAPTEAALEASFHALPSSYDRRRRQSEATVVRWEWARNCRYDPRPLWYERQRRSPGHLLVEAPTQQNGAHEYGFDDAERLVVERQPVRFDGYPERLWFYETFHEYSNASVESAHYSYDPEDKEPIFFAISTFENGQITSRDARAQYGRTCERYQYKDLRITRIDVLRAEVDCDEPQKLRPHQRVEATYDASNALREVAIVWSPDAPTPRRDLVYSVVPDTVSLDDLCENAANELLAEVRRAINKAPIRESVYCLALVWSPGELHSMPPLLGLGLEHERDAWIAEHGKNANEYLWNPAEFSLFDSEALSLGGDALEEACRILSQELGRSENWQAGTAMLNSIAEILGKAEWGSALTTTEDFVAYATDFECSDFPDTLAQSTSAVLYRKIKDAGWLP